MKGLVTATPTVPVQQASHGKPAGVTVCCTGRVSALLASPEKLCLQLCDSKQGATSTVEQIACSELFKLFIIDFTEFL